MRGSQAMNGKPLRADEVERVLTAADMKVDGQISALGNLPERIPVLVAQGRQSKSHGPPREQSPPEAHIDSAGNLLYRFLDIPERDRQHRQQPLATRAGPLSGEVIKGLD